MADLVKDSANDNKWPMTKFFFSVEFDGGTGGVKGAISFQEVSGLDQEVDIIEYRHGDSPVFSNMKKPGMIKYTNVVFKKGYFKADSRLTDLFKVITDGKEYYSDDPSKRLTVKIKLLDENGKPLVNWQLNNAFPVKLTGTDLKSDATEIAIESLEVAHEGLTTEIISS